MKKYFYIAMSAFMATAMTSCSDDKNNEPEGPDAAEVSNCAYVLNQGNFYNGIEGGLSVIDYETGAAALNVFKAQNNRSLGDTPQCGVAYGSKIYIGTSISNTIEIIDRASYLSYKQFRLSENPEHGTSPYSMIAHDGKVFISMYDGYLARLDTLTMTIDKSVAVGANPDQIALYNNKIYVPVSEGMNYPNYGTTACIVDPKSMTVEKTFTVGLNPTQFFTAGHRLFLLCKGNYEDVASKLYEIKETIEETIEDDEIKYTIKYISEEICNATMAAPLGNRIAVIDQPFVEGKPTVKYSLYNLTDDTLTDWNIQQPDYANAMYYDAVANRFLIASYIMNGQYPSYDLPGYVNVYDATDFSLLYKTNIGAAGPACIFTLKK